MTGCYYLSRTGLTHRVGNLRAGELACGRDFRTMTPVEEIGSMRCRLCWRIGARP